MRQFLDLKSFIGTPKVKQGEHEEAHKALSRGEEEGGGLSSMDNKHGWNVAEMKILVILVLQYISPFIVCLVYIQGSHFCCVSDLHWVSVTPSFFH